MHQFSRTHTCPEQNSCSTNKTQPAKTESEEKHRKDTLNSSTTPVEASENMTLNVNQTVEYSFSEQ